MNKPQKSKFHSEETSKEMFKRLDKLAKRSHVEKLFAEDMDADILRDCEDSENGFDVGTAFERLFEKLNYIKKELDSIL